MARNPIVRARGTASGQVGVSSVLMPASDRARNSPQSGPPAAVSSGDRTGMLHRIMQLI
jgi:hypothetical protein